MQAPFIHHAAWVVNGVNVYVPRRFKPAGRSPVKGGRWYVRRRTHGCRAWTAYRYRGGYYSARTFHTWDEALAYVHKQLVPRQATLALLMIAARLRTLRSRGSVAWELRQMM